MRHRLRGGILHPRREMRNKSDTGGGERQNVRKPEVSEIMMKTTRREREKSRGPQKEFLEVPGGVFRVLAACLSAAVLLYAAAASAAVEDAVHLRSRKGTRVLKGVVVADNLDTLKLRVGGGGNIELSGSQVISVEYDITDPSWRDGLNAYRSGQWREAADNFAVLLGERKWRRFRDAAKPYLLYLTASALRRSKQHAKAFKIFEKFINDYGNSRYLPAAAREFVETAIVLKRFQKVPAVLAKLRGLRGEFTVIADYCEALMRQAQNRGSEADRLFRRVALNTKNAEMRGMARLGQAECAEKRGRISVAREAAQKALAGNPSAVVAAKAHLIIGRTLFAEAPKAGSDKERQAKFTDALLEFLRVPVCWPGDERVEPEALLLLARCHAMLAQFPGHSKDRKAALYWLSVLRGKYAGSSWAVKGGKEEAKLR